MRTHDLKTTPEYFGPLWDLTKTFDIRWDDRAYQPGDRVILREFDPNAVPCRCITHQHPPELCSRYTGRLITSIVGFLASSTPPRGGQPGFRGDGYVVLSLLDVTRGGVGKDPGPQDAPGSSDAPSPVSDGSLPSPERPAATMAAPDSPSPASVASARRRRRGRAVLERRGDEHIPVAPPRVAFSTGGES